MTKYFIKYLFITGAERILEYTDRDRFEQILSEKEEDVFVLQHTLKTWEEEAPTQEEKV